jgi:hypothetical protein
LFRSQSRTDIVKVDFPFVVNRKHGDSSSFVSESVQWLQDRRMLNRRGDNVHSLIMLTLQGGDNALDRQIIAFGTAARKQHFRWTRIKKCSNTFARFF